MPHPAPESPIQADRSPLDRWAAAHLDPEAPPGLAVGRGWAQSFERAVGPMIEAIAAHAPFRRPLTPRGNPMRLLSTSVGRVGSVADGGPYRYEPCDPQTRRPWPPIPDLLSEMATRAADAAGFPGFAPDTCIINRYEPGASLGLHQDKGEPVEHPIVSLSFGVSATFLWGGHRRTDSPVMLPVRHGDVLVWGGPHRLRFHGVLPVPSRPHPTWGTHRINLTFRQVL